MLLALLLAAQAAVPVAPVHELRGLWVVRTGLVTPAAVDAVVDAAAAGGLNALFVQVRGRGDAFYQSRLVARSELLRGTPADFDPLARLIERARLRGLAVHAWVNVLLTSHFSTLAKENEVSRHPEWLMVPRKAAHTALPPDLRSLLWRVRGAAQSDPDVEGYYLSPSVPAVGDHLEAVVRELVRGYPVDGLHLDFIRYPNVDYDYSVAALEGFAKREGEASPQSGILGLALSRPAAFAAYRRDALTALAARLVRVARSERPGLVLSAAVVPDRATAVSQKFQDWPGWLGAGLLDALCPMTYTPDDRIFRAQLRDAQGQLRAGQAMWAGVGAYRLDVAGIVEKVALARAEGAAGVVLFSHESLDLAQLRRLREQAFAQRADVPGRDDALGRAVRARGLIAAVALGLAGCHAESPVTTPSPAPSPTPSYKWSRATLGRMDLPHKAAQLIGVRVSGLYRNSRSAEARKTLAYVHELGAGAIVLFESEVESVPRIVNELQAAADVPLLVAGDFERGLAFRIRRGVVPLPFAMALGATRSEADARFAGEVTAREARALGIHWTFAPVADVNNNPANPIINIRSFGEDPELVARLSSAFIRGAHSGGLLTTAKHFPGHGDTAIDSHLQIATVGGDLAKLNATELVPFRRDLEAGVDAVMIGHIAVPALDPTGTPASLSAPAVAFLRGELGFHGLVVTDAIEMAGARAAWSGESVIKALQAGADMVLLPPSPEIAVQAIVRGVKEGQLDPARIDASVLRILEAKERLGLEKDRHVDPEGVASRVARPEDVERAFAIARESITLVRNNERILPLRAETRLKVLHLVLSSDARNDQIQGFPEDELEARRIPAETRFLGPEVSEETAAEILAQSGDFTHVLVSAFARVRGGKGTADMSPSHARLIESLVGAGRAVIVVSFGSPYLIRQFPSAPVFVCAYGSAESSQRAALGALFGEYPVHGRLPVTIPGVARYGDGIEMQARDMTLKTGAPEEVGFRPGALDEVDRLLEGYVAQKAFPGGVLAVGRDGVLVHLAPIGHFTYDAGAPAVKTDTIYDLASLTKVIVTTTAAMILVDEGKLDITKPVASFLPKFTGGGRERVTVFHLLTHSSGLDAVAPLYKDIQGKDAYLERIQALPLGYEPGTRSVYSDLGEILLGEIVERVAGESLDAFARRRILTPLGMRDTGFKPPASLLERIAPTENDPWRGRLVRGEVHDENAYALGGVAPHAGLFGTAPDLARFAQMLLNGGVYDQERVVSRATLEEFTRRAGIPGSSRALGWDTPAPGSSAGSLFSPRSFGHTGFTGTSLWIDPDRQLFVILLTNRVYPTRDNDTLPKVVRAAVADAVVRALAQP